MFNKILVGCAALIMSVMLTLPANALSALQVQQLWAQQGNLRGTFDTVYADGERARGSFAFSGPRRLAMHYSGSGNQTIFDGNGIQLLDTNYPDNNRTIADTRLRKVFSSRPSFAQHSTIGGQNAEHTLVGFSDSEGSMKVYFSNQTGRLDYLVTESTDGKVITEFTYNK